MRCKLSKTGRAVLFWYVPAMIVLVVAIFIFFTGMGYIQLHVLGLNITVSNNISNEFEYYFASGLIFVISTLVISVWAFLMWHWFFRHMFVCDN